MGMGLLKLEKIFKALRSDCASCNKPQQSVSSIMSDAGQEGIQFIFYFGIKCVNPHNGLSADEINIRFICRGSGVVVY